MAQNLILSKESSESEIKRYFNAVLKLSKSDNEFPINLDEVWMLVYNRRDYAADALKKDFIENVDYIITSVKTEVGSIKYDYFITVSCMEFFIARKVRPVFEVYRKVFHHIANTSYKPKISEKLQVATWLINTLNLNESSKLILAKSIADPLGLPTPDYTPSRGVLKSATELLRENNIGISARDFNKKLEENGLICTLERDSSKGKKVPFKSITGKGKEYGENQVNANNPKSTQPLWYEEKFNELLALVRIS